MAVIAGIDYGFRRIGVAISDADERMALAGRMVPATGDPQRDAQAVLTQIREYGVGGLVVGLPINMDGTEGPQAKATRRFAQALQAATGLPLEFWDERLTSAAADWAMQELEVSRGQRKARRDVISAQIILQGYLDAHRGQAARPPGARTPETEPPADDNG